MRGGPGDGWDDGSFRDPDGRVYRTQGRVLRALSARGKGNWEAFCRTGLAAELMREGLVVESSAINEAGRVPELEGYPLVLEHQPIPFISYPYEWPFTLLKAAALATLELLQQLFAHGLTLKDATPLNIQFIGTRPVFIDVASIAPRPDNGMWTGYAQFCETFLYPLMFEAYRGVPFQPFLRGKPDGIPASTAARVLGRTVSLRKGGLIHVCLRDYLERRLGTSSLETRQALHSGSFSDAAAGRVFDRMTRLVSGLETGCRSSGWMGYSGANSYTAEEAREKRAFVQEACTATMKLAWDLGANDGVHAQVCAERGVYTVAMDADSTVVDALARNSGRGVLPLVMDVANPSPPQGWRAAEFKGLAQRGEPDLALALALIHHIRITANVPLADIVRWLASLAPHVVVEFVGPDDPMTRLLLIGRENLYADYTWEGFVSLVGERFDIVAMREIKATRRLLHLVRKGPSA